MRKIPAMVDMALDLQDDKDVSNCIPSDCAGPRYPYGLSISLEDEQLEKIGVDISDWEVGDLFHLHAMAKITSKSSRDTTDGSKNRVELQIVMLTGEDEDGENEEAEEAEPVQRKKPEAKYLMLG